MIIVYKRGTRLARIAKRLSIPVMYPTEGLTLKVGRRARFAHPLNWGYLGRLPAGTLNENAVNAARKVRAFELFNKNDIPCPSWSRDYADINKRVDNRRTIFARRDGLSGGKGIEIIAPEDRAAYRPSGNADFFVNKISHLREFRMHVWNGQVIVEQVKFIPQGSTNPIHNHENGCKFSTKSVHNFLTVPQQEEVKLLAIRSVAALGLFFGAVDIIMNTKNKFYVLEVNTAPGIKSDVVEAAYTAALRGLIIAK